MAVVLSAGVPTHVVTILCHLVTDAAGVGDAAFDEVVRQTRRAAMRAFNAAYYHPESADAVTLTIRADTHHLAPADMRACLQGIESILVDAVYR